MLHQTPSSPLQPGRDADARHQSVALIGLRGSGKTTVGRALARLLNMPHVDTDDLITRQAGLSIAEIFAREHESGFRDRERQAVAEAVAYIPAVISVGGGAVLDQRNVEALRRVATVVWLTARTDELWRRVCIDPATPSSRPPLSDLAGLEELTRLLAARAPHYERAADWTIDTKSKSTNEVAEEIEHRFINR